jgi:hypothetical protein
MNCNISRPDENKAASNGLQLHTSPPKAALLVSDELCCKTAADTRKAGVGPRRCTQIVPQWVTRPPDKVDAVGFCRGQQKLP